MQQLTDEGRQIVRDVAHRYGFSDDAVTEMLSAVAAGYGNQAQFNHPELGGMGQWSCGGMMMIGDMFNNLLKGRVGALCGGKYGISSRVSHSLLGQRKVRRSRRVVAGKPRCRAVDEFSVKAA